MKLNLLYTTLSRFQNQIRTIMLLFEYIVTGADVRWRIHNDWSLQYWWFLSDNRYITCRLNSFLTISICAIMVKLVIVVCELSAELWSELSLCCLWYLYRKLDMCQVPYWLLINDLTSVKLSDLILYSLIAETVRFGDGLIMTNWPGDCWIISVSCIW